MTLTEFLLARIAEDETPPMLDSDYSPAWTQSAFDTRWLAEREAKRGIVEDFEVLHRDYRVTHDATTEARRFQARIAVARLALPYAEHPDYDEAWRP